MDKKSTNAPRDRKVPPKQSFMPPRKEKVMKWHLGEAPPTPIVVDPGVDSSTIMIHIASGSGAARTIVMHHPIGVTNLDRDDWVASSGEDLKLLLARKDNPNRARIAEARRSALLNEAIRVGILTRTEDGKPAYDTPNGAVDRQLFRQKKPKDEEKAQEIDPQIASAEQAFQNFCKERQRQVEELFPDTYATKGGQLADKPQSALPNLKGLSMVQVMDALSRVIYNPGPEEREDTRSLASLSDPEPNPGPSNPDPLPGNGNGQVAANALNRDETANQDDG